MWNLVNLESKKIENTGKINSLNINGLLISDYQKMSNEFIKYI
jgi:hypothetical protein